MNLVAVAAGVFLLRSVEHRLVYSAGEELRIAAAGVADKLDRLLFERYGDAHMMAQALALRPSDTAYLSSYVGWMKTNHAPVYAWLGVTDSRGMMIAATESSLRGQDFSRTGWFQRVSQTKTIQVDDVALHEGEGETESVAFSAPMLDAEGNLSGIVSSRVPVSVLEEVTTGTLRSLEARPEFAGAVVFQMVTDQGRVFVDSDLRRNRAISRRDSGALSPRTAPLGDLGFVEEQSHGQAIVTGFARTKGVWSVSRIRMACPGAHGSRSHPRADPFHIMEGGFDGRGRVGSHGRPFVLVDLTTSGRNTDRCNRKAPGHGQRKPRYFRARSAREPSWKRRWMRWSRPTQRVL